MRIFLYILAAIGGVSVLLAIGGFLLFLCALRTWDRWATDQDSGWTDNGNDAA